MLAEDAFQVEGVVTEVRSSRSCIVKLENGHVLHGFVTGRSHSQIRLVVGQIVDLHLSAYDLSAGRILTEKKKFLL